MSGCRANTVALGPEGRLGAGPGKPTPDGPCVSTALFCAYMGAALTNIMSVVSLGSPDTALKCPNPTRPSGHLESCEWVPVASIPCNSLVKVYSGFFQRRTGHGIFYVPLRGVFLWMCVCKRGCFNQQWRIWVDRWRYSCLAGIERMSLGGFQLHH